MTFTRRGELEGGLEGYFRFQVRKQLDGFVSKLSSGGGIPDRMVILPGGRIVLVELKKVGGAVRPDQRVWHSKAAARGVTVALLSGKAEIDAWIEQQKLL